MFECVQYTCTSRGRTYMRCISIIVTQKISQCSQIIPVVSWLKDISQIVHSF